MCVMSSKPMVIGGKLKLKGSGGSKPAAAAARSSSALSDQASSLTKRKADELTSASSTVADEPELTEAQRKFKQKKMEAYTLLAKKQAKTTFRDRVDEFNLKLSKLTEHNDIPRVSAAGNG